MQAYAACRLSANYLHLNTSYLYINNLLHAFNFKYKDMIFKNIKQQYSPP